MQWAVTVKSASPGMDDFLAKPVTEEQLGMVRHWMDSTSPAAT